MAVGKMREFGKEYGYNGRQNCANRLGVVRVRVRVRVTVVIRSRTPAFYSYPAS